MSKTLEELGYEKDIETEDFVRYAKRIVNKYYYIRFYKDRKIFQACAVEYGKKYIIELTFEELKAIYKYCEDNKWI